ncbi:MAG TPA: DinB family protein [Polyangiaceae bacterium]|nr:DinB family protein [Polyangiaceae bacterium]
MSHLVHHFVTMAYNNAWSNHRLLGAVNRLTQADFEARRTSFFPSLKATLNHILTVDWYYVDALERGRSGQPVNAEALRFFEPEEPFDACDALRAAQSVVDRRLLDLCVHLTDAMLDLEIGIMRSVGVQYETVTRLLAHLFVHQTHHRGQAHAMLAGTSVEPPQLDEFFCVNDAHLRAVELAELGYSETTIWATPDRR